LNNNRRYEVKEEMSERLKELLEIQKKNHGILLPEKVVEAAENPKSALHDAFEWDDSEAARLYRLHQARNMIRVIVEYEPDVHKEVRAFISLRDDRKEHCGGYKHMPTLLKTEKGRKEVLETALWELQAFHESKKGLAHRLRERGH